MKTTNATSSSVSGSAVYNNANKLILHANRTWAVLPQQVCICVYVGGSSEGGHVFHHPSPVALSAYGSAAGTAGLWPARGLCGDAEEGGTIPWCYRQPPTHWLAVAEPRGIHQWGESPVPALCVRTLQTAIQSGRHHAEVSDHQSWSGKTTVTWLNITVKYYFT